METNQVLNSLRHDLTRKGKKWRDIRGGVALEFRDGCDAFFYTPGSAWPESNTQNPDIVAGQVVNDFERLDNLRWQVLIGLASLPAA